MDFKQLKIMALALSLPGVILSVGFFYQKFIEEKILPVASAILVFGLILIVYILVIIKILFQKK